jgi:peptide-methionine (S)-S-oxide reductase
MKFLRAAVPVALVALLVTFFVPSPDAGRVIAASEASTAKTETAVLAGGCFWGMESVFEHVRGVTNVVSGFSGGSKETAHYDDVSEGDTGHAESVEITYDPARISYATLLDVYFRVAHDPTELNAQGPDSGTQYRSAIFYASPDQKRIAEAKIAALTAQHVFPAPIVTQVVPLRGFYPAESYHQHFAALHPLYPYIVINDAPKLVQLRERFPKLAD